MPEAITATITRDDQYTGMGQYLHLEQKIGEDTTGWTASKFDVPESWAVRRVAVEDSRIVVVTQEQGNFAIDRDNFSPLFFDILDGGEKTDTALNEIWRRHALDEAE